MLILVLFLIALACALSYYFWGLSLLGAATRMGVSTVIIVFAVQQGWLGKSIIGVILATLAYIGGSQAGAAVHRMKLQRKRGII